MVASSSATADDGSLLDTMLSSAVAGMLVRVPLHPVDTLKAKLQVQQQFRARMAGGAAATHAAAAAAASAPAPHSLLSLARHTVRAEGLRGLYSGFGVTFLGGAPAACIYFTTYDRSKTALQQSRLPLLSSSPFVAHFASGLLAEAAACVLWVPVDVVKERLQVQQQLREMISRGGATKAATAAAAAAAAASAPLPSSLGPLLPSAAPTPPAALYRGNLDAILTIARTEGVRGVYRGYGATLASFGPFSAIYFSGYEQCKQHFGPFFIAAKQKREGTHNAVADSSASSSASVASASPPPPEADLGFLGFAFCGGFAGSIATVLTNPMDLVKLRMQVQRGNSGFTFGYRNMMHGLQCIVAQEGPAALFKGAAVRCAFHIPSTALTIAMFDSIRAHLTRIRQGITAAH